MILDVGNKVFYPHQGPCLIGAVVDKIIGGTAVSFYQLALLDNSGDAVFIPVDKAKALGVRQLIAKNEIPKLLKDLSKTMGAAATAPMSLNWKQRAQDNSKLLASGSAFDLTKIIRSLTELNEKRALAPQDRQALERAKKLLVCEIAEVLGESKSAAEELIESALQPIKSPQKLDNKTA